MNFSGDMALMISNYSHDIATAFLAISGFTMWLLAKKYPVSGNSDLICYFINLYASIKSMAMYSLAWILIAGVPRVVFYRQFEWSSVAGDLQVVAIIIKHIAMFLLVGTGVFYWLRLDKKVSALKIETSSKLRCGDFDIFTKSNQY